MSFTFAVLCLAGLAVVASLVSALSALALPWLSRAVALLAPRHRVFAWLWLAVLPALMAVITVGAALLPGMGFGLDHCLAHHPHAPDHLHLCPRHVEGVPGASLVVLSVLLLTRCLHATFGLVRGVWLSVFTSRALGEASEREGDVWVFKSPEPQAFVLGIMSPRVHASEALLKLGGAIADPALAHERAHASARDSLWRALCPVLACLHLPGVAGAIVRRCASAQEVAADDEAALALGDRFQVAESLLALARWRAARPVPGVALLDGDLSARVHALVGPRRGWHSWPKVVFQAALASTICGIVNWSEQVHHGLETVLGLIS